MNFFLTDESIAGLKQVLYELMNDRTLSTRIRLCSMPHEVPDLLSGRMNMGKD